MVVKKWSFLKTEDFQIIHQSISTVGGRVRVYVQRVITMRGPWIEERSTSRRGSSSHRADSAENS